MYLVRLIYASQISPEFKTEDIEKILEVAQRDNKKRFITGMLCFNRKYFLQCLEGSREVVNNTYQLICRDKRHQNIVILDYCQIDRREFADWSMGYVPSSRMKEQLILSYSPNSEFNPFELSGDGAYGMMLALRNQVEKS